MSSPPTSRAVGRRLASGSLPIVGVIAFLALWQILAAGPLQTSNLPRVLPTLEALSDLLGDSVFWAAVRQTLLQAVTGFALSVAIAVPLGLVVGTSALAHHASKLTVEMLKAIPVIVVLPLAVLQLGTSDRLSIFLVMFTLIPMLIGTVAAGARDTDPVMLDAARSYGLGRVARTWQIVVPSALPFIATGLRVGAAFALIVSVLGGLYGGAPGLGHDLDTYRQSGLLAPSFAYVVVLGTLGIGLNALLTAGERYVLFWHESIRRDAPGRTVPRRHQFSATGPRVEELLDDVERRVRAAASTPLARAGRRVFRTERPRLPEALRTWFFRLVLVAVPLVLVAMWWAVSADSENPYFPPLSEIVQHFRVNWLTAGGLDHAIPSLRNLVVGFIGGAAAGILAGVVIGQVRWLFRLLNPLISFFRSIPSIAYLPILIAVIGFSTSMRVVAITLAAFFPVLIAAIDGVRSIDETLLDATRSYRIPRLVAFFSVRLPAALPRIFAGAELGLVAALIVMVASELIGTSEGIGAQVLLAQQTFQFSDMWAGLVLLAAIGIASNLLFRVTRGRLLAWYDGSRAAGKA